jgi:glyoxylase-like metal-dependent hydrolase (beta-lactamase superfamily II)/rhodanese-related sulfurtransferase
MHIEQIYTGCLAQGAYYIHSNGEAAIIDPLREVTPYIKRAEKDGVKIKYIFETHFHADFVSGHLTLQEKTGAPIIYGPEADPSYKAHIAEDGEIFELGNIKIKVLHTPGHTIECTTYLLYDEQGKEHAIFTGDTLFLGDVGRPDLSQKSAKMTTEDLAGMAYDSLRNKIMPLPDDVIVYPAHGAGSACGKNMMKETVDTLGNQKKVNYALRADMTKEEFIKEVTADLPPPPAYFPANVRLNREGYSSIDSIITTGMKALSPEEFEVVVESSDALMLDVRTPLEYAQGHIPKSIFIGLKGSFAPWVGELIVDIYKPIVLITNAGQEKETITRLSRVGFDNVLGYLDGGIESWTASGKEIDTVDSITAEKLQDVHKHSDSKIFDVRKTPEYHAERIDTAHSTPLSMINEKLSEFPKEDNFYIHCVSGYRSMIAASILKSRGYHNFINVSDGFNGIKKTEIPTTKFQCPSEIENS